MDTSFLTEQYLQALYRYRKNIGWISSVYFDYDIATACIDTHSNVKLNPTFCETWITCIEDWAFLLGHENGHKTVSTILCSNFELNWRYSLLSEHFGSNYMQDLFINQMLFHAIPSTVPERYYGTQPAWDLYMLQRSPKILKKCPQNTPELENKLKLMLLACNRWYRSADYIDLFKVFETACDYLLLCLTSGHRPQSKPDQMMVQHEEPEKESECSIDPTDCGIPGESETTTKIKYKLNIPFVDDFSDLMNFDNETYQKVKCMSDLIEDQVAKIPDIFGNKSYVGYSDPQVDELVAWQLEQYIPWTERFQSSPDREVKVIFDVSGSMFPYLTLLSKVQKLLQTYKTDYYAFSTILAKIEFFQDHAETYTGAGTDLDPILALLDRIEPCLAFIITDGGWGLRKKKLPDEIQAIFEKHRVVVFQQGISKIPHLPSSVGVLQIGM